MFRLSQKSDYGLILLSNLAKIRGLTPISAIAKKNKLSSKFLSQVALELKKAGILMSKEGTSGGYALAKSAHQIKVLDVLTVLDGGLVKGDCFEDDHECKCGAKGMWGDMKKQMEETIGRKTVADLVAQVEKDLDIRHLVNEATQGILSDDPEPFVVPDVSLHIMPKLVEDAVAKGDDEDQIASLRSVQLLIRSRAVAIVVSSIARQAKGLDEDVSLRKFRVQERQGFSLAIVVNPTVAYEIASGDDREVAVLRVKDVMLETYRIHGELSRARKFIPNYDL